MQKWILAACFTISMSLVGKPAIAGCSPNQVEIPQKATIAFEGDSLTYGFDTTETNGLPKINNSPSTRSKYPFPESLGGLLNNQVQVINRGYPGDRSTDGFKRWANAQTTQLTVIMYGTNDYGNYGGYPDGGVSLANFERTLRTIIMRRMQREAKVIVMIPPPIRDPRADAGLEPYRRAADQVARESGAVIFDATKAVAPVEKKWTDGLHLSEAANQAIARSLSQVICIKGAS